MLDVIDPNRWKFLESLQEKINKTSKTLRDLKNRKETEEIKLRFIEINLISMNRVFNEISNSSDTFVANLVETLNESNKQDDYLSNRKNSHDEFKKVLSELHAQASDCILETMQDSLKTITLKTTLVEKEYSDFVKNLEKRREDINNSMNGFIVLQYYLSEETETDTDLYKEAYSCMTEFYAASSSLILGASSSVKDMILQKEESISEQDQLSEEITLPNNKIAHEFFKQMILLMAESLDFKNNNTVFEIIKKVKGILPKEDGSNIYRDSWDPEGKNYETTLAAVKKAGSLQKHITHLINGCKKELTIEEIKFVRAYENMYEYSLKIQGVEEPVVFVIFIQNTNRQLPAGVRPHFKGTKECWGIISIDAITEQVLAHELAHVVDIYKNNKNQSQLLNSMLMEFPSIFAEQIKSPLAERYSPEKILIPMLFFLESEMVIFEALKMNNKTKEFICHVLNSLGDKKELMIRNLKTHAGYFINEMIVRYFKKNNIETSFDDIINFCKKGSLEDVLSHYNINIEDLASLAWDVYFAKAVNN